MQFFINGTFLDKEQALLPVLDLGLLRGYGVFDYLRTYGGRPFHCKEHLARFFYSAKKTALTVPHTTSELESIIEELLRKSGPGEKSIKILLTGGISEDQLYPQDTNTLIAFAYPLTSYPKSFYTDGIKVLTTSLRRSIPCSKTTQYLPAILALKEGKKSGAAEALYLNDKQEILEATTSNFFAFKHGVLLTPPEEEIMIGITREVVLRLAKELFPIEIRPISKEEIPFLDEAFVSASNKEIMPVTHIDGIPLRSPNRPLTQKIMDLFAEYAQKGVYTPLTIARYSL